MNLGFNGFGGIGPVFQGGELPLPGIGKQYYTVYGGPFWNAPKEAIRVLLARELNCTAEIKLPIRDFQVPDEQQLLGALREVIKAILIGEPVYVGCMGGRGRTGLFLACLAKAWGIKDPIAYVRAHYEPHALETLGQEQYVTKLVIPRDIRWLVQASRYISRFSRVKHLTRPIN